ncbi:hypothetical protein ACQZV8_00590 [Magnetococcales bacterium HHB-1]
MIVCAACGMPLQSEKDRPPTNPKAEICLYCADEKGEVRSL